MVALWKTVALWNSLQPLVVLNRWYDNTKKKAMSWLFATDVPLLTHRWKWIDFLFGSVRYRVNVSVVVVNIWQLVFNTLCLNGHFGKKEQPVSSPFHIPNGFAHNSGHVGGLRGFLTDRETVYRNCLPMRTMGRKTWWHGDPHAQNYTICSDDLARINMIYHFYTPGYVEYSSIDKMAKCDWNSFRSYVAFLAGGMAPGTRSPHHDSESTSCYHDAFLTWGHSCYKGVLLYLYMFMFPRQNLAHEELS